MDWYYADGTSQLGPFSEDDFGKLVQAGTIRAETLVWRAGMGEWQRYDQLGGGGAPPVIAGVAGQQSCSQCGRVFAPDDMIHYSNTWVCAACKPVFLQKLKEGAAISVGLEYAGFWIRVGAWFLDWAIMMVVNMGLGMVVGATFHSGLRAGTGARHGLGAAFVGMQMALMAVEYSLAAAYETFFVGKFGATPGKMACKLRVVTPEGGTISYARALGRHFAKYLSGLVICIGYLMVAFDKEEHRGLHDRICATRVVRR